MLFVEVGGLHGGDQRRRSWWVLCGFSTWRRGSVIMVIPNRIWNVGINIYLDRVPSPLIGEARALGGMRDAGWIS